MTTFLTRRARICGFVGLLAGLFGPASSVAQTAPDTIDGPEEMGPKQASVVRMGDGDPRPSIDGRLDDPIWATAEALVDFIQRSPNPGEPSEMATEAHVLVGRRNVYVAIRAHDPEPHKIVGRLTRRDRFSTSDWVMVLIDSDLDRRTSFQFFVNPAGVEIDGTFANGQGDDWRWDAVWDVATNIDDEGWTAEFKIPLSMLRFSSTGDTWGFQIARLIQRLDEMSFWAPTPNNDPNEVAYFGEIHGMAGLQAPRRLEVLPYTLSRLTREPEEDDDPFHDDNDWKFTGGMDLKYGVTSNLILDATVNPDFGQVEADPSEVNLTAFETFFRERRPFFVEGSEIFRYGLGVGDDNRETLFYSRRIGRQPQGEADDRGGWVDAPTETSIAVAAKLSGRTAGGWSIGVLEAVTEEEKADVVSEDGEAFVEEVEPLTNYALVRLRKDLREGRTQIGLVGTSVNRRLEDETMLEEELRSSAYTGGVDVTHRFHNDEWRVSGKLLGSRINGSEEAILEAQTSSARYFQRPDAGHVVVDSTRTHMSGAAGVAEIMKESGGSWRVAGFLQARSPDFEANDLGFMRETDMIGVGTWVGYRLLKPNRWFRQGGLNLNLHTFDNFDGLLVARGGNINGNAQFHNFWFGYAGVGRDFDNWRTDGLRGGPAIRENGSWFGWWGISTDDRKSWELGVEGDWSVEDETGGWRYGFEVEGEWQPTSSTRISLEPFFESRKGTWQYVDTTEEDDGTPHYVFADLDQKTFGITTRIEHTFTPNFSLQLYAQPFVSAGDYTRLKEAVETGATGFDDRFHVFEANEIERVEDDYEIDLDGDGDADYEFERPDFNFREFRSTFVARWEYRPGSTIFFVWSQDRESDSDDPTFDVGNDFDALFGEEPRNIFLVKINGWLNL